MAKFTIELARSDCIGCGACAAVCPDLFKMNSEDNKSDLAGAKGDRDNQTLDVDEVKCGLDAANTCPVTIIHITDNQNKKKLV